MRIEHALRSLPLLAVMTIVGSTVTADCAQGETWDGREEHRDGVPHVLNPDHPRNSPVTVTLKELWRLGGDSQADEEFFGVINKVVTDPQGNAYLLDRQLSEIKVYAPDGGYLLTIGREGEGPGEFRSAVDLLVLPDETLAVIQMMPGKVVLLTPEGDPVGELPLDTGDGVRGNMIRDGGVTGDVVVLQYSAQKPGPGRMTRTTKLTGFDVKGKVKAEFVEATTGLDFANPVFREGQFGIQRWSSNPEGVFVASADGDYKILHHSANGDLLRVIERRYEKRGRTDDEMEEMKRRITVRGFPNPTIEVRETDPDISGIHAREDGTLWILNSRAYRASTEATLAEFDVFTSEGRFVSQVTLVGEGDPTRDRFCFAGDRLFVIRNYADAMASMLASDREAAGEEEDPQPIEVICFELDASLQ